MQIETKGVHIMSKKIKTVITFIGGIILIICGFLINNDQLKNVSGILLGVGASFFGLSINYFVMYRMEERNPEIAKQNKIELMDERNTMIRNRAKAKAGDITAWLVMAIAYLTILIKAALWVTLAVVLVFVIHHFISLYFMSKYEKEM